MMFYNHINQIVLHIFNKIIVNISLCSLLVFPPNQWHGYHYITNGRQHAVKLPSYLYLPK